MERLPFSLRHAEELCQQYGFLVGQRLFEDKEWLIDSVAVAPTDKINQWLFAHIYAETGCPVKALHFYRRPQYEVILISVYDRQSGAVSFLDIRTYLAAHLEPWNPELLWLEYGAGPGIKHITSKAS